MALGVTPLRVGQEAYWLDQIARDACEYYAGKGESPGWWVGSLADRAGLQGEASKEAVHRLFAGQDPLTNEQRVAPVWRADPRSKLPAGPLQAALRELAAVRGVEVGELAAGERPQRELKAVLSAHGKVNVAAPRRVLNSLYQPYLEDPLPEWRTGEAFARGLGWATKRVFGTAALLTEEPEGLVAMDYLVDHEQRQEPQVSIPEQTWDAALAEAPEPNELLTVGSAAYKARRYETTERAWQQAAATDTSVAPIAAFKRQVS